MSSGLDSSSASSSLPLHEWMIKSISSTFTESRQVLVCISFGSLQLLYLKSLSKPFISVRLKILMSMLVSNRQFHNMVHFCGFLP